MTLLKFGQREASLLCAMTATIALMPVQAAEPDIVVTEQDNGKSVTLHGDQRLIVKLSAQPSTGYGWWALMTPDSLLAFTTQPAAKSKIADETQDKTRDRMALPIVGGPQQQEFAFRAARFTETSSQWFLLIFCGPQCDLKDTAAMIFKIAVNTQKK
jgi:predicted secreted protein